MVIYQVLWWPQELFEGFALCDYCGELIVDFPCAVLADRAGRNRHALCKSCTEKSKIKPGDTTYTEMPE
jgi:formylmethanofuran dehydrogenase subunit E